jgi:hypothetical protein
MSRIGKGEWIFLYIAAGVIDVVQWLAIPTIFGAGADEIADPFIGIIIAGYLQWRGVSMITHLNRLMSLIGAVGLEEFSFSVAPAWMADIWYIHRDVRKETAKIKTLQEQEEFVRAGETRRYVENGIGRIRNEEREPRNEPRYVSDGIGRPRGNIRPTGPALGQVAENEKSSFSA